MKTARPRNASLALATIALTLLSLPMSTSAQASESRKTASSSASPSSAVIVDLALKGTIGEDPVPLNLDGAPLSENLRSLAELFAKAKADPAVKGILLRVKNPTLGLAKAHELRAIIADFRSSGKRVCAYLEDGGNTDYLIAAAADEIAMPESATLALKGLAAEVMFYKGLFEKVGVAAQIFQVGDYKGSGEVYTRAAMSPEFREELTSYLNDSVRLIAEAVAKRLGIAIADAQALIEEGPYSAPEAKTRGLISRVRYEDEIKADLAKEWAQGSAKWDDKYGRKTDKTDLSGMAGLMKMMQMLAGEPAKAAESKATKIAVIYCSGVIMTGKSSGGSLMGEATLGSESVIKDLRQAESDPTVKGIVLRIDSPGGSALASDLMWREITRIQKPIVASMSDTAASGGYYMSMGCDKIYAAPGTLTGSIGVVGGKISIGGALEKLGLKVETVEVGKNARYGSMFSAMTPAERESHRKTMEEIYRLFVAKAAQGRKMGPKPLEALAGGRVYGGRKAKEIGLIDEIGTLDDAVRGARELAGLKPEEKTELLILPKPQGLLESLMGTFESLGANAPNAERVIELGMPIPEALRPVFGRLQTLKALMSRESALLMAPYHLRVR